MAEENKEESLELEESTDELIPEEATENSSAENTETPNIESIEENPEFVKKKKKNIVKIALFGVIGLLVAILITGVVLYFLGFFDPEEPVQADQMKKNNVSNVVEKEEPKFSLKDINTKNLNKQLSELTNKTINKEKEAQRMKELEEERKALEEEKKHQQEALAKEEEKLAMAEEKLDKERSLLKEKQTELEKQKEILDNLKEEALLLKEEMLKQRENFEAKEEMLLTQMNEKNQRDIQKELDKKTNNTPSPMSNESNNISNTPDNMQVDTNNNYPTKSNNIDNQTTMNSENVMIQEDKDSFLLLINVAKIKGELYKNYLDSIVAISSDVKLCRDDANNIEIYFGPFNNMEERSNIYNMLQDKNFDNSYEVELTKEEFNKRCNY